ncbi:heavy metal translocating P-type ATPase [Puia dinghuensis]|uniref:Copper-translocating P-type ATPase n=1 Tax=Puia dinghuensis TaxID=1792502 RepID=A0A8J2UF80_9BACT|nr:cation-translocating P-type ATPase [Puia dinghuensis]GGB06812.1 copper-translocating P-type ATPase [Puia dinghuensis]
METINWKIEGMSCSTCALTIGKYLEKNGLQNVKVSLASGDVSFDATGEIDRNQLEKGIHDLGYTVLAGQPGATTGTRAPMNKHLRYFLFCLPFTLLLFLPMLGENAFLHWLMHPWVQLFICLPVFVTGMLFFGRSAVKSLINGLPNMNVLIALGATAAFVYSLTGTLLRLGPDYLFYETTASIITIVFFGYYLEDASVKATQRTLNTLAATQKTMANMIAFDHEHQEILFPVENSQLRSGDLILIRTGEQIPADCKILWGEAGVDESILTGESLPVDKKVKDSLIGGSILVSGTVKAQVTAVGDESILAGIVRLVRQAQGEKPPIQQLADKISAVFVPVVLGLAALTFIGNYLYAHQTAAALMRSIAVLVIACPCAMGLATPAAIAVGLGRGARKGILIRNARHLEAFRNIRQVVFDKTGTLTTGEFSIRHWHAADSITPEQFREIAFSLEKYSNHPIARGITKQWKVKHSLRWAKVEEVKGLGMRGETQDGEIYWAGSYKVAAHLTADDTHNVYIVGGDRLLGFIDVMDTVRPEAASVVRSLHEKGIHTVLLSGDRLKPCQELAAALGIKEVLAEQSPEQKLGQVTRLNTAMPVAMVGDGINDAPALARATIGLSMSDASQLAMQTADVVLMNHGLRSLPAALGLGRHTFGTIKGNLFWAFFYNSIAIPVAAFGFLTPALAALVMGFSDVVLAANSLRLYWKKLD